MKASVGTTAALARDGSAWPSSTSDLGTRLAPLSGVAFFVLLVGSAITSGGTPDDFASGAAVNSFYAAHQGAEKLSNLLAALGVVFLVSFASMLRTYLRSRGAGALASAVFGGSVILAVGGAARAGIGWELATGHAKLDPSAAQALNSLYSTHYPAVVGIAVLMFAAFFAILRTRALPIWLGWVALPLGLLAVGPPTLIPLIGTGIWMLVTGTVIFLRAGRVSAA